MLACTWMEIQYIEIVCVLDTYLERSEQVEVAYKAMRHSTYFMANQSIHLMSKVIFL